MSPPAGLCFPPRSAPGVHARALRAKGRLPRKGCGGACGVGAQRPEFWDGARRPEEERHPFHPGVAGRGLLPPTRPRPTPRGSGKDASISSLCSRRPQASATLSREGPAFGLGPGRAGMAKPSPSKGVTTPVACACFRGGRTAVAMCSLRRMWRPLVIAPGSRLAAGVVTDAAAPRMGSLQGPR